MLGTLTFTDGEGPTPIATRLASPTLVSLQIVTKATGVEHRGCERGGDQHPIAVSWSPGVLALDRRARGKDSRPLAVGLALPALFTHEEVSFVAAVGDCGLVDGLSEDAAAIVRPSWVSAIHDCVSAHAGESVHLSEYVHTYMCECVSVRTYICTYMGACGFRHLYECVRVRGVYT